MKIQSNKLLKNYVKIKLQRERYKIIKYFNTITMLLHTYCMINVAVAYSKGQGNLYFLNLLDDWKSNIQVNRTLSYILSLFLIAITFLLVFLFFFIVLSEDRFRENGRIKQNIMILIVILWMLFDFLSFPAMILIATSMNLKEYKNIENIVSKIVSLLITQLIIIYSGEAIIYSFQILGLLIFFQINEQISYLFLAAATLYRIYIQKKKFSYFLVMNVIILIILSLVFNSNITLFSLQITTFIVILIQLSTSYNHQNQNDFLLKTMAKLENEDYLNPKQSLKVLFIIQKFRLTHQRFIQNKQIKQIEDITINKIGKENLGIVIGIILDLLQKQFPLNYQIKIQKLQCQLMRRMLNISDLYTLWKLNFEISKRQQRQQIFRIESLISKIESQRLNQQNISSWTISRSEKMLEQFYDCIGCKAEQLEVLWSIISQSVVQEQFIVKIVERIIFCEQRAINIIRQLKNIKNMRFQIDIFNYLHQITNADACNPINQQMEFVQEKLKQTRFLLISNNIIEDASRIIIKSIAGDGSLKGLPLNQILYGDYHFYLEKKLQEVLLNQVNSIFIIPFKVVNYNKRFYLGVCTINILPNFSEGIKFLISFCNQGDILRKYVIYCSEDDTVHGFSDSFFEHLRLQQAQLPETIIGKDIFNVDLGSYLKNGNKQINCELNLKIFRKGSKSLRRLNEKILPLNLVVKDTYTIKYITYSVLQIITKDESIVPTAKQTINLFAIPSSGFGYQKEEKQSKYSQTFCLINNPLESIIDDKLSKVNSRAYISYFQMNLWLFFLIILVFSGTLFYLKMDVQQSGRLFSSQLTRDTNTNNLIQTTYLLYYQYYQYYQIKMFPDQILKIQYYNIPALVHEYKKKANSNIVFMLPQVLNSINQESLEGYKILFKNFQVKGQTNVLNLIDFLSSTKKALADDNPYFLIKNYPMVNKIISSLTSTDNQVMKKFLQKMKITIIVVIVLIFIVCIIIKIFVLKIGYFQAKILTLYSHLTRQQINRSSRKLKQFISILTHTKYYHRKQQIQRSILLNNHLRQTKNIDSNKKFTGIKISSLMRNILDRNILFLVPLLLILYLIFFYSQASVFTKDSSAVLEYSEKLETFFILVLQRATQYFQIAMENLLPQGSSKWTRQPTLKVPTLTAKLPLYFKSYKQIEQKMLDYNLCKYSYLNTGTLYSNIICEQILDGMLNHSFTQSYSYLLQQLQKYGGNKISSLGQIYRPSATYPFYMEVCYTRRTINNMLAFIQAEFNHTVAQYIRDQESYLLAIISFGLIILPFLLILFFSSAQEIKSSCQLAIKLFKILPRKFIMKIKISKMLRDTRILDQLELITI